jgi:hypothetical protein
MTRMSMIMKMMRSFSRGTGEDEDEDEVIAALMMIIWRIDGGVCDDHVEDGASCGVADPNVFWAASCSSLCTS